MRSTLKLALLAGSAILVVGPALAQTAATTPSTDAQPTTPPGAQPPVADTSSLQEIVVTGNTSGKRTLFNSSSDVTIASTADILRKAPRSTAETLELVPGIFVQGTAGPVSNNYSVRGLGGGGQAFITLEEDGLPVIYQGGGADEYFQNDITIDRVEAVKGGTSGILAPNGAGATINFISLKPNFDKPEASVRFTGTTYGDYRADGYFSAPITDSLAFNVGGYVDSDKGFRRNPFAYNTYHVKAMLQKRFDDGGYVRLTIKRGDEHDPYYADMPFQVGANGSITSIPGLNLKRDDIGGNAFASILVPDSCATGNCVRRFSQSVGLHTKTQQYRIDIEKPITEELSGFVHARYLKASFDFNGIFPGSTGNTPFPAGTYLDPTSAANPVAALETRGLAIFGPAGATHFGLRDTQGGPVISSTDTAALTALNGNGLLQETVLNHALTKRRDFGSDFGVKWDKSAGAIDNSLTVGGMVYKTHQYNDQSGVTTVVNDVRNNSHIYDIVALDGANNVVGQLTNNGMVSYGNWGQSVFKDDITSLNGYFNDELKIGSKLHIDFGARYEHQHDVVHAGNAYVPDPTVAPGTPGIITDLGQSFNGTYTRASKNYHDWAYTGGVNYALTNNISFYGRYARGFQTNGGGTGAINAVTGVDTPNFNKPSDLTLYEGGVRGQAHGFSGSVVAFRTIFKNQSYSFNNPDNPAETVNAVADDKIWGIEVDATWKPVRFFSLDVEGVYQKPTLTSLQFSGAAHPEYNGNSTSQTPHKLLTVTPSFILPGGLGEIYGRWKYISKIYADPGNGVSLPSYSVFTVGASLNVGDRFNIGVSVDNLTDAKGFTEGNPRQGQTQSIVNGYFYGRAIVGRNALVTGTVKL
jgi:outer membrane receptor protein involved in Fe transport